MSISIIIPCYNEADNIRPLYNELSTALVAIQGQAELVFVDDGSTDQTLVHIRKLPSSGSILTRYISFSRNFGKEAAILAGLEAARGDYIVIIDADLQDDPHLIIQMYKTLQNNNCDCVAVKRGSRAGEPHIRSAFAKLFYRIMGRLSSTSAIDGERDYRMMTRQVVDAILSMPERTRYSKGLFAWVGFRTIWIEETYHQRSAGQSKWSFFQLSRYAMDAITSFSTVPLAISSMLGILLCIGSILGIIVTVIRQLVWGGSAYGWSSLVCIILLIAGVQLFCIGVLGRYLGKVFTEVKQRPPYIIREQSDENKE